MLPTTLPRHVAIIMDGNGRWASEHKLPRAKGHQAGIKTARRVIELSSQWGIQTLSLFAFGRENWRRPEAEVQALQLLMAKAIDAELPDLHENQVRLSVVGDIGRFEFGLQKKLAHAQALTQHNTGLVLIVALNYSGQWHMTQVAKRLACQAAAGELDPVAVDFEQLIADEMQQDFSEPDLLIRTSGVNRISNYYLWHLAYTEFAFVPMHWPDFDQAAYLAVLQQFAKVQRRFGRTPQQITGET